jgi:hypothetical protein
MIRGMNLGRTFSALNTKFDIDIRRAALGRYFDFNIRGLF